MSLINVREELKKYWRPEKADFLQKYFFAKDGNASKDIFRGISVPNSRIIAKKFHNLSLSEVEELLHSPVHEERLISLFILVIQYEKADQKMKEEIINVYRNNTEYINEWDLVDSSADRILGNYLIDKSKDILIKLAKSEKWWERRIAVMATFQFIKKMKSEKWTLKIITLLIEDKHDLIHKACGWMLREIGKRISVEKEEEFLKSYYSKMPRTMLRYAIEHFPEDRRKMYLTGKI